MQEKFLKPVAVGDTKTVTVTVSGKDPEKYRVTFDCRCTNQKGKVVSGHMCFSVCKDSGVRRFISAEGNLFSIFGKTIGQNAVGRRYL